MLRDTVRHKNLKLSKKWLIASVCGFGLILTLCLINTNEPLTQVEVNLIHLETSSDKGNQNYVGVKKSIQGP